MSSISALSRKETKRNTNTFLSWSGPTILRRLLHGWTTLSAEQIAEIEHLCDFKKAESWRRELERLAKNENEDDGDDDREKLDEGPHNSKKRKKGSRMLDDDSDIEVLRYRGQPRHTARSIIF